MSNGACLDTGQSRAHLPNTSPPLAGRHLELSGSLLAASIHGCSITMQTESLTDWALSHAEVLDRIEHYVETHPAPSGAANHWVEGFGWDQTRWADWRGGFPSKVRAHLIPIPASFPYWIMRTA